MKLRVVRFGKPAFPEYRLMAETYEKRLRTSFKIEAIELKLKPSYQTDAAQLLEVCGGKASDTRLIVFDETGLALKSMDFAANLKTWTEDTRVQTVTFVIGPPFGYPDGFLRYADKVYALSSCTLTSDLAWLTLWEQLYRGVSILKGGSYHHE